jgi:hypothetical protein
MTPAETAAALKKPIGDLGMAFMADPATRERGKSLGLRGRPFYYLGRGGALGDVPAEVAVAAFAFAAPAVLTLHWNEGRAVLAPPEAARSYAECCNDWGRRTLTGLEGTERVLHLLERVADGAEGAGLPLFAGWRAMPRPDDLPGRLAQVVHVMREHRGSAHAAAIGATGLGPLEATIAGSYGVLSAKFFEWPEPYPDPEPFRVAWQQAEHLTSVAAAAPYEVLTGTERAELVAHLKGIHATLGLADPLG